MHPDDTPDSTWPTFCLSIAGIGVSVACNDHPLVEQLSWRYREFPLEGDVQFAIRVELMEREGYGAFLEVDTAFRESVMEFKSPAYEGFVDTRKGYGQLSLSSAHPQDEVEYFLRVVYSLLVFNVGGLLFHAAGIVRWGRAYLFFGHSGSGKTTVSRLSSDNVVLNDDLIVLLPQMEGWIAYATPFWNPTQVRPTSNSAPVAGLFRLVQDKDVFLEVMGKGQALAEMVASVPVIPDDRSRGGELMARCGSLLEKVPAHLLHFLPDSSFWGVVEEIG